MFNLRRHVGSARQNVQYGSSLLAQMFVRHQISTALQGLQILPKFLAQAGIVRLLGVALGVFVLTFSLVPL